MIEEVMRNEDRALGNLQPEQDDSESISSDSDVSEKTETKRQTFSQVQV